jgi:L-ascorbate metabolism protein UlaG (beta-lactamase superfamily)
MSFTGIIKRIFMSIAILIAVLAATVYLYMLQPKFGRVPSGERLEKIRNSPNYRDGSFQNQHPTPDLTEGVTYYAVMKEFFFSKKIRMKPEDTIPSVKTDLRSIDIDRNILVWFGHSSYYMQIDGKRILVDPVFSGAASPLAFTTRSFIGTDVYSVNDFPDIDYLFISHDHWDHLDYQTVIELKGRVRKIICGLGTGEHFERWGFDKSMVFERDWNEEVVLDPGVIAHLVAARHFSGRGFTRNKALWTSFVLKTTSLTIYIGGDSGYDSHFRDIGQQFGPFDLAILENGQYDKSWKYIHMMPEEVITASKDLHAARLFPVHSSKFSLGNHSWDEPLKRISTLAASQDVKLVTPIIGEIVALDDTTQQFTAWWERIK